MQPETYSAHGLGRTWTLRYTSLRDSEGTYRVRMGRLRAPGPAVVQVSRGTLPLPFCRVIASSWACD